MREVLQLTKSSAYANNRELMTEAAKLRDKYSTHLVLLTLRAACKERSSPQDIIFHSDRGSPYTSMSVRKFCREHGMNVSYSRPHQTLGFLTPDAKEAAPANGGSEP